jgi:DNA-binding transcriptional regulator LsrR (DeoR family)
LDAAVGKDRKRDDAARAAWLYFVQGRTQDEIAAQLDLSRQAVQRLVTLAVSEKLIKFRLDHPIAACMELAERLTDHYGLEYCDVTPSDRTAPGASGGVAAAVADRIGRLLAAKAPVTLCVGTGRTLRAAAEEMETLNRPQHKIMSLGGVASPYDVVMRLGDRTGAQRYPMPAPVVATTAADRAAIQALRAFEVLRELREGARASFVGISEIAWGAPFHRDGFVTDADIASLVEAGAVGEVTGWSFDAAGRPVVSPVNERVVSLDLEIPPKRSTVIVGSGPQKAGPFRAALTGGLCTAVITDEATAAAILEVEV